MSDPNDTKQNEETTEQPAEETAKEDKPQPRWIYTLDLETFEK